jgi:hypothetical protein
MIGMDARLNELQQGFNKLKEDILDMSFHVAYIEDLVAELSTKGGRECKTVLPKGEPVKKITQTTWYNYIHFDMDE